jgi:probable addiction module antidote protein
MEKIKLTKWDSASYLKNEDDIAAYLQACFEEAPDDASFIAKALGTVAKARGMTQLAKDAGMGRESLYKALSGAGNPSFSTVLKVANALGLKFTIAPQAEAGQGLAY